MTSKIKVDTIEEKTSANGVSIDGVKLKDNILTVQGTSTTGGIVEIENTDTSGANGDYFGKLIFKGNDSSSSASGTRASVEGKVTGSFGSSQIDFLTASGGAGASRIATISPDGLSLADGNITFEGSGHGIHLGVTTATASNLLDDYEEGTVTLAMSDSGTSFTMASGFATGYYTKIGDRVYVNGYIKTTSINSGSGTDVKVTGLPFTSKSTNNSYASVDVGYQAGLNISAGTPIGGFVNINGTQFYITTGDSTAGISNMTAAEWTNDGEIVFSLNYIAA